MWCRNRGWKHVALRSDNGRQNAAHHLLREGLGGSAELGVPASCALDRHRSVWLRPPELPHPDGVLDGPLRGLMFAACCETPGSDGVRPFPVLRGRRHGSRSSAVPGGHSTSVGGSSHWVRLRLVREQASSGVRRSVGPGSGSSSSRTRSNNPLIGGSSELLGLARRRRSVEGQPPVVLCHSWAHPSGRNFERRSSLVSFGTHLPTSNVPTRVRGTDSGVIFGWQWRRPRPLDRAHRSDAGVIFG